MIVLTSRVNNKIRFKLLQDRQDQVINHIEQAFIGGARLQRNIYSSGKSSRAAQFISKSRAWKNGSPVLMERYDNTSGQKMFWVPSPWRHRHNNGHPLDAVPPCRYSTMMASLLMLQKPGYRGPPAWRGALGPDQGKAVFNLTLRSFQPAGSRLQLQLSVLLWSGPQPGVHKSVFWRYHELMPEML